MSFEKAKADLEEKGLGDHVIVLNESSAPVAEAAMHWAWSLPASPKRCWMDPFVICRVMPAILIPYCRRKNC